MPTKEVTFQNKKGQMLRGVLRYPEDHPVPAVIVLHAFASRSNHEFIVNIANHILPYGYAVLRFDFHGHGESDGDFHDLTITQQVDDVIAAMNFIETCDFFDQEHIALIGHDLGADVALLTAAKDKRVSCLILQAARADLEESLNKRFSDYDMKDLFKNGFIHHPTHGRIHKHYFEHLKRYDPAEEIKKVHCPILFVHGRNDFQVPFNSSHTLYLAANEPKRFEILDNADHELREHREEFFSLIIHWLNRWLKDIQNYNAHTTEKMSRSRLV